MGVFTRRLRKTTFTTGSPSMERSKMFTSTWTGGRDSSRDTLSSSTRLTKRPWQLARSWMEQTFSAKPSTSTGLLSRVLTRGPRREAAAGPGDSRELSKTHDHLQLLKKN